MPEKPPLNYLNPIDRPVSEPLQLDDAAQPNHVDALLTLRGLACLVVVVHHCSPPRDSILFKQWDWSWLLFGHGTVAVWIFFCLSGYLMGKAFYSNRYTFNRTGVLNFFRNRVLRIFPLYYFVVFLMITLVYPYILKSDQWKYLLHILTFTYDPFGSHHLPPGLFFNVSIWSLSTEVQFYILVPFFYLISKKFAGGLKRSIFCLLGVIGLGLLNKLGMHFGGQSDLFKFLYFYTKSWYAPLISSLDLFLAGFLINPLIIFLRLKFSQPRTNGGLIDESKLSTTSKWLNLRSLKISSLLLMLWLYGATAKFLYSEQLSPLESPVKLFGWQAMTAIVTVFFIFSFEIGASEQRSMKLSPRAILHNPWRSVEILGLLSYGVYLWHGIIIGQLPQIISPSQVPMKLFITKVAWTLGLSGVLAVITYCIVELPAARYKLFQRKS
jgi:peptidoglycan/LPS O-acetylase OafA/YrhL